VSSNIIFALLPAIGKVRDGRGFAVIVARGKALRLQVWYVRRGGQEREHAGRGSERATMPLAHAEREHPDPRKLLRTAKDNKRCCVMSWFCSGERAKAVAVCASLVLLEAATVRLGERCTRCGCTSLPHTRMLGCFRRFPAQLRFFPTSQRVIG
jgi:hypothetical protein